jgi:hypothetical protein
MAIVGYIIAHLRKHNHFASYRSTRHRYLTVGAVFLGVMGSHTIHVYLGAFVIWLVGALPGYEAPIYYALVTYTTVGYGDVVLDPAFRIMGAMISVTGIVMFGATTAFLVGLFGRLIGEN